jgi:hypothetical protein
VVLALILPASAHAGDNSLICVFTEAPASSASLKGSQFTVTGLSGPEATAVWPDGHDERLKKIFENENLIVLQMVSAWGSTDTVYLELKNKKFLVVSVGALTVVAPINKISFGTYRGYIK